MHEPVPDKRQGPALTAVAPSLLRLSIAQRLVIAAVLAAGLWGAVAWALDWVAP